MCPFVVTVCKNVVYFTIFVISDVIENTHWMSFHFKFTFTLSNLSWGCANFRTGVYSDLRSLVVRRTDPDSEKAETEVGSSWNWSVNAACSKSLSGLLWDVLLWLLFCKLSQHHGVKITFLYDAFLITQTNNLKPKPTVRHSVPPHCSVSDVTTLYVFSAFLESSVMWLTLCVNNVALCFIY